MELYYSVQTVNGQPSLVLEERAWFDLNRNLKGPRRHQLDALAEKCLLAPNGDGSYASGQGITTAQAIRLMRSWGNSLYFNPEVAP